MSDYIPQGKESEIACNYSECDWGMGLAGLGRCSGKGNPRDRNCPQFTTVAGDFNGDPLGESERKAKCSILHEYCMANPAVCEVCDAPEWKGFTRAGPGKQKKGDEP